MRGITADYMYGEEQDSASGGQAAPHIDASRGLLSRPRHVRFITDYMYSEEQDPASGGQAAPHIDPNYSTVMKDRSDHSDMFTHNTQAPLLRTVTEDNVYSEDQDPASGGQAAPHTDPSHSTATRERADYNGMFISNT